MAPYLTREEFEKYLEHFRKFDEITVDTEGTLDHPFSQTWGLSISAGGVGDYFAFYHRFGDNLPESWLFELRDILLSRKCLDFHHAKHDLRALRNLGIDYRGPFHCTMLMSHMTDENRYSQELDSLSKLFGGEPKRNADVIKSLGGAFGYDSIPVDIWRDYGFNDAYITEELKTKLQPDFELQGFEGKLWGVEQEFAHLLMDMEDTGIRINQPFCEQEYERGTKIMSGLRTKLGFNPNSTKDLEEFLLGELKLPVLKRTKKGNPSFDKEVMQVYDEVLDRRDDDRAKKVLAYRGWSKTTGSNYGPYLEKLSQDGRFRVNFKQHGTVSGRLSASILHQIPKQSSKDWNGQLKMAFIPRDGYTLWDFDYSQVEFRLTATYAKQQSLLDIFNDDTRDIFNEMAAELGMERDPTKTLNYTIMFGGGWRRISAVFGVSELAAKAIINKYYKRYPRLRIFKDKCEAKAREKGWVGLWTGRRRHFMFESEYHKAQNSIIQGGAFEIVKRQLIKTKRAGLIVPGECDLVLQVHDDAVFEIENGKEHIYVPEIIHILENVRPDFGVKFKVDAHKWGTKEQWAQAA